MVQLLNTVGGAPVLPDDSPRGVLAATTIPASAVPETTGAEEVLLVANFAGTSIEQDVAYAVALSRRGAQFALGTVLGDPGEDCTGRGIQRSSNGQPFELESGELSFRFSVLVA